MSRAILLPCCLISLLATMSAEAAPRRPGPPPGAPRGAGASYRDIHQADGPTCWILASMAALQHSNDHLAWRIRPQGRNWYAITLYNFNNPGSRPADGMHTEQERVYFDGKTTPADPKFDPRNPRSAWAVIVQRAVIQAVHDWDPSQSVEAPHGGGAGDALSILTGRPTRVVDAKGADVQKAVGSAVAARRAVVMGMQGHCWAVLGVSKQGVRLYNPYGSETTISWDDLSRDEAVFVIDQG
jgi:hypothetical protein